MFMAKERKAKGSESARVPELAGGRQACLELRCLLPHLCALFFTPCYFRVLEMKERRKNGGRGEDEGMGGK